ncbi:hypothetical protein YB2330_000148 [Saitoella coloradoensis]
MGNRGSSTADGTDQKDNLPMRTCYYELLGVDRDATSAELTKAYRKGALKWHPDRNYGNVEEATERFAEIQVAYDVLSDDQERAWYDSHRDAILRGQDVGSGEYDYEVAGTTVPDLMKFFDPSVYAKMDDSPYGFYTRIRTLFDTLDREEEAAARNEGLDYTNRPSFGDSNTSFDPQVKDFHSAWGGFVTEKSFSWCDQHRYADAADRRVRRAMEKENKKARDTARKEYNDTVRQIILFIRKRDPRYKKATQMSEKARQAALLAASKAQAAKDREAFRAKLGTYHEPEWMKSSKDDAITQAELEAEFYGDEEVYEYECVACNKSFKSENQFEAHEKSKKHVKAIQALKRRMQKEAEAFDFEVMDHPGPGNDSEEDVEEEEDEQEEASVVEEAAQEVETSESQPSEEEDGLEEPAKPEPEAAEPLRTSLDSIATSADEDYGSIDQFAARTAGKKNKKAKKRKGQRGPTLHDSEDEDQEAEELAKILAGVGISTSTPTTGISSPTATADDNDDDDAPTAAKKGAKAKRAARKAKQEAKEKEVAENELVCVRCEEEFDSRNQLFEHIKRTGHAAPQYMTGSGPGAGPGKGKKGKRR